MSAIAGIVSQRGKYNGNSARQVRKMLDSMRHRGPDNMVVRSLLDDRGALGAVEINLEPSTKSFCTFLDAPPHVLFTGQLYNQQSEKMSDVVLFHDFFDTYEEDAFSKLDGNFSAAIAKQFNPNINLFTVSVESKPGPDLENAKLMSSFLDLEQIIYTISDTDIENVIADCVWYLESFDEDCISGILSNYYASKIVKESSVKPKFMCF